MNEQEFKAKLSKIVCKLCEEYSEIDNRCVYFTSYEDCPMFNKMVEALILAGIGDVSELQKECESKEEAYNKCYSDYKYWKDKAKEYKCRAERVEAENAELKARLEKAVELPRIVHPNPHEWFVQYEMESGLFDYLIFYSKQAAEARLAELRGE